MAVSRTTLYLILTIIVLSGCSKSNDSYYPLDQSFVWHYEVAKYGVTESSQHREIVQNAGELKEFYIQEVLLAYRRYIQVKEKEIRVARIELPDGKLIPGDRYTAILIKPPYEAGTHWNDIIISHLYNNAEPGAQDVIEAIPVMSKITSIEDTVKVPAGNFSNCIRVDSAGEKVIREGKYAYQPKMTISLTNSRWYAPGVGLVKETQSEQSTARMYEKSGFSKKLIKLKI